MDGTCAWVALPLARALPAEQPRPGRVVAAAAAAAQLAVARAAAGRLEPAPAALEAALARVTGPADLDGWVAALDAAAAAGWADRGLATALAPALRVLGDPSTPAAALACALDAPTRASDGVWLQAMVDVIAGISAAACARGPLVWIRDDGAAHRRLVGTAFPALQATAVGGPARGLCFAGEVVDAVPRWLARWDEEAAAIDVVVAPRLPAQLGGDSAPASSATSRMAAERVVLPPSRPPASDPVDGRLVVRVLSTRFVLRTHELVPHVPVIVGRSAQAASWVLRHHQISRAHVRIQYDGAVVRVSDCGSTNGTQLDGQDIGRDERVAPLGSVIGAGPLLLRVERISAAEKDQILALAASDDRDALTRLLLPKRLGELALPPETGQRWGVLLYIDKLTALHAQYGEQVADGAFAVAARVLQSVAPEPMLVARLGYGEMLVPAVHSGEAECRQLAQRLAAAVTEHPWEPPLKRLHVVVGIGRREPGDDVPQWIGRIRHAMQAGRRS